MNNFRFSKIKNKILNIHRTITYSYIKDPQIKGTIIKYGKSNRQYYKVYTPDINNDITIFFVHGGGWWHGNPSLYSSVGKYFYKMGYNSVIVGYRLAPFYRYPSQIEDVFTALNHYIKNTINNDNIIVSGYSAGGELASHIVFDIIRQEQYNIDNNKLKGFISISGVLDFLKCKSTYSKFLIKNYIFKKEVKEVNPINLLNKEVNIPIICIHGDSDSLIDLENSISFINKAQHLDENVTLKIIRKAEHEDTIDIVRGDGNQYSKYILDFIQDIDILKQIDT
ncbi:MAG: alpha/beta hydrolase [Romboutsia sp.]